MEHSIKAAVERNQLLTTKRPVEFIKRSTASPSLRIAMWRALVQSSRELQGHQFGAGRLK